MITVDQVVEQRPIGDRYGMAAESEYTEQDAKRRLKMILQGAFSGPPTQLKDIPTRTGESRSTGNIIVDLTQL
jgi:hypothetical protein